MCSSKCCLCVTVLSQQLQDDDPTASKEESTEQGAKVGPGTQGCAGYVLQHKYAIFTINSETWVCHLVTNQGGHKSHTHVYALCVFPTSSSSVA